MRPRTAQRMCGDLWHCTLAGRTLTGEERSAYSREEANMMAEQAGTSDVAIEGPTT